MIDYVAILFLDSASSVSVQVYDSANTPHTCTLEGPLGLYSTFNCGTSAAREVRIVTASNAISTLNLKKVAILSQNRLEQPTLWSTPGWGSPGWPTINYNILDESIESWPLPTMQTESTKCSSSDSLSL